MGPIRTSVDPIDCKNIHEKAQHKAALFLAVVAPRCVREFGRSRQPATENRLQRAPIRFYLHADPDISNEESSCEDGGGTLYTEPLRRPGWRDRMVFWMRCNARVCQAP